MTDSSVRGMVVKVVTWGQRVWRTRGSKTPFGPTLPEVWWLWGHGGWAASGRSLEGQQYPLE